MNTKIALVADLHLPIPSRWSLAINNLNILYQDLKSQKIGLLLINGDLTNQGWLSQLNTFFILLRNIRI